MISTFLMVGSYIQQGVSAHVKYVYNARFTHSLVRI